MIRIAHGFGRVYETVKRCCLKGCVILSEISPELGSLKVPGTLALDTY